MQLLTAGRCSWRSSGRPALTSHALSRRRLRSEIDEIKEKSRRDRRDETGAAVTRDKFLLMTRRSQAAWLPGAAGRAAYFAGWGWPFSGIGEKRAGLVRAGTRRGALGTSVQSNQSGPGLTKVWIQVWHRWRQRWARQNTNCFEIQAASLYHRVQYCYRCHWTLPVMEGPCRGSCRHYCCLHCQCSCLGSLQSCPDSLRQSLPISISVVLLGFIGEAGFKVAAATGTEAVV